MRVPEFFECKHMRLLFNFSINLNLEYSFLEHFDFTFPFCSYLHSTLPIHGVEVNENNLWFEIFIASLRILHYLNTWLFLSHFIKYNIFFLDLRLLKLIIILQYDYLLNLFRASYWVFS